MSFDELLAQVRELLRSKGRVTYRALKRRFELDDDYLADLMGELIEAERVAVDEDGKVLVWQGHRGSSQAPNLESRILNSSNSQPPAAYTPPISRSVSGPSKQQWKHGG
ncbi:MAG TPA: hypothetical protein VGX03_27015 [Candidatus Binatia bacterium]|nr:hypothetical protein [Candidatus Binatia bacterium]